MLADNYDIIFRLDSVGCGFRHVGGEAAAAGRAHDRCVRFAGNSSSARCASTDFIIWVVLFKTLCCAGQSGEHTAAVQLFERVLKRKELPPKHRAQVYSNLAYSYQLLRQLQQALANYDRALNLESGIDTIWVRRAYVLSELGEWGKAAGSLQKAVQLNPGNPDTYMHLGDTLNNLKQFNDAIGAYRSGLSALERALRPRSPNYKAGQTGTKRSASLQWDAESNEMAAKLHHHIADALANQKRPAEAAEELNAALRHTPYPHPFASEILPSLLFVRAELADWGNTTTTDPSASTSAAAAASEEWSHAVDAMLRSVEAAVAMGQPSPLSPYYGLFFDMTPDARMRLARSWSHQLSGKLQELEAPPAARTARSTAASSNVPMLRRLNTWGGAPIVRIGYISRRFYEYPGTHLMMGMFNRHSANRTEVHCFASGPDDDTGTTRRAVAARCKSFTDLSMMDAATSAAAIVDAGIDVLIDYDGLHDFNNIPLLSLRPAPVQTTFLGYAATTGMGTRGKHLDAPATGVDAADRRGTAEAVDYIVVDPVLAPPHEAAQLFTESLWYMPGSYQPQDPEQRLSQPRLHIPLPSVSNATTALQEWRDMRADIREKEALSHPSVIEAAYGGARSEAGDLIVYACFNRWSKIDPAIFSMWMQILRETRGAILWLYGGGSTPSIYDRNATTVDTAPHMLNLWTAAAAHAVHPGRIVFAPKRPRAQHLWRHYAADVMLDTRVYGAHTTAADGLFTGLPVITLLDPNTDKPAFAARVAASLLAAQGGAAADIGITASKNEYVSVAVELGNDPALLLQLRGELHAQVLRICATRGTSCGRDDTAELADAVARLPADVGLETGSYPLFDATRFTDAMEKIQLAALSLRILRSDAAAFHILHPGG
jgi:predicted O-linked N-acetylglucosamine transferase (SPINDLY family)